MELFLENDNYMNTTHTHNPTCPMDQASTFRAAGTAFFLALLTLLLGSAASAQTTVTFNASGNWLCPPGVTSATIECWGGGGAGGSAKGTTSFRAMGGAGAGGSYASSV